MQKKMTRQLKKWCGEFGRQYTDREDTDRGICGPEKLDVFYKSMWGVPRSKMNREFLYPIKKDIFSVLEVGSNVGNQLVCLQSMGFKNLYGIEIQEYAVEKSKKFTKNINIVQGSAFDIPFKDKYFDMVFTSGVLIHIAPSDINVVLDEIYRCSNKYIWGFEYYADKYTEINYRGNNNLLWKTDFCKLFLKRFKNLVLVKEKKFGYVDNDNVDSMFLLKKRSRTRE